MDEVEAVFVAMLNALDPGLAYKPERAIRRGRWTCFDISAGKPQATVLDNARQRFDGGHARVDAERAAEIVAAVTDSGLLALYEAEGGATADDELEGLIAGMRGELDGV